MERGRSRSKAVAGAVLEEEEDRGGSSPIEVRVQEASDRGAWIDRVRLGEGPQVDGTLGEQRAEQSGADQGKIERPLGIATALAVFAPGDIATVMIAGLDAPVTAARAQQLLGNAFCG